MTTLTIGSPHTMAYALCGMALCVGGISYILHTILFKRKSIATLAVKPSIKRAPDADYSTVFPPSQRQTLAEILPPAADGYAPCDLAKTTKPILGLTSDYRKADPSAFIFSGFTVGDVKALGDFPDYAKLTGVPLPNPVRNFDLDKAYPRPYRPFRWNYHQTMAYGKMDPNYWLELESTYCERIRQRQDLFAKEGKAVLQALPGSELACKELMEMCIQFLCARYPEQFQLEGKVLVNRILNTTHDLSVSEPLHVLIDNVPEDFALVLRDQKTGRYIFQAGIICSSVGWTLGEKMGLSLSAIHGPVPDYKQKLEFSMERWFTKVAASNPIQRGSWGLEFGQPLYLPADHPDFEHRSTQNPNLRPEDVHLRVDWQTLRRLPLSGAVVFNFKALFTPMTQFREEPYIPSLLLKVITEAKENLLKYKGTWHIEHVAKPELAKYERYQIESGLIEKDWNIQTLDESPFYPGWQKQWPEF